MTQAQEWLRSAMTDGDESGPEPLWTGDNGPETVLMGFRDLSTLWVRSHGPDDVTVTVCQGERMAVVELGPDGPKGGPDCRRMPYPVAVPGVGMARLR